MGIDLWLSKARNGIKHYLKMWKMNVIKAWESALNV